MQQTSTPNIILLVWDSARVDYVEKFAATVDRLRGDNLWFEAAIAPATWSLPSHASIFSGEYPHEHGLFRIDDKLNELPLVSELSLKGYSTIGISGNGFASPKTGFHEPFDEFHYTVANGPFHEGINVTDTAMKMRWESNSSSKKSIAFKLLRETLQDDYPAKSLANVISSGLIYLAQQFPKLSSIPHPLFQQSRQWHYSPETNTNRITRYIGRVEEPFFLFANYMDAHHPYSPPTCCRTEGTSNTITDSHLRELNKLASPWEFIRRDQMGHMMSDAITQLRSLYAGEIQSVDTHLERIMNTLEDEDILENTVIIITSDHGEQLGEPDLFGNKRFGHEATLSLDLIRVPLLIVNPSLDQKSVSETVSIKQIFHLLTSGLGNIIGDTKGVLDSICEASDGVLAEYPALGGKESFVKNHPDINSQVIDMRAAIHHTIAVNGNHVGVADSTGHRLAWEGNSQLTYDNLPESLQSLCEQSINKLTHYSKNEELSEGEVSQLEALGYM